MHIYTHTHTQYGYDYGRWIQALPVSRGLCTQVKNHYNRGKAGKMKLSPDLQFSNWENQVSKKKKKKAAAAEKKETATTKIQNLPLKKKYMIKYNKSLKIFDEVACIFIFCSLSSVLFTLSNFENERVLPALHIEP